MVGWMLAVLGLVFSQALLAPAIGYAAGGKRLLEMFVVALGPRDDPAPTTVAGERARRALANLYETLPIFLTLGLLSLFLDASAGLATLGAAIFFIARIVYVPLYIFGIFGWRTAAWCCSVLGLLLMAAPILVRGL